MARVLFIALGCLACHTATVPVAPFDGGTHGDGSVAVLRHHENPSRDGLYVDPLLTRSASAGLHRDAAFSGAFSGHVYAQPLYVESAGSKRPDMLVVATESNEVLAFDPTSGAIIWRRTLATPVPLSSLPCGNIDPLGITGTPVSDGSILYLDTMALSAGAIRHLVWALNLGDGSTLLGWPVDVQAALAAQGISFDSSVQNERGALALLTGSLFVPYGGHYGDCGSYNGWLVALPLSAPQTLRAWHTRVQGGGAWAPGGVASDGASVYLTTGNTFGSTTWSDGEGVFRFGAAGAALAPADSFTPSNWKALDDGDIDLGGSGPVLVHVAGATPPDLVVALGKDGYAYLLDRAHFGGIGGQLSSAHVSDSEIIQAAAAYPSGGATYLAFRGSAPGGAQPGCDGSTDLATLRLTASAPPAPQIAWCAHQNGAGSPIATSTDGSSESLVWSIGAEGDQRLRAFHGETGALVVAAPAMGNVRRFVSPIVARGRIYVAGDDRLYAFTVR